MAPDRTSRGTPVSRRRVLRTTGALASGLAATGTAGADDHDRQTANFTYVESEPNDYYVREGWLADHDLGPDDEVTTILMMDGYMGASAYNHPVQPGEGDPPSHYVRMRDDELVAVDVFTEHPLLPEGTALAWASIRGTGCSSGQFDLFDDAHAVDGAELIDWLGEFGWTNDRVGLFGASYSGITALHIAEKYGSAAHPGRDHLTALSANMVVADLYRDITYPGGVPNSLFPALWTKGIRPAADTAGTFTGVRNRDAICAQNAADRTPHNPADDPLVWYTKRRDGPTWTSRSAIYDAAKIDVPTYISQAWQDEQTGPRAGVAMYDAIDPGPAPDPTLPDETAPPAREQNTVEDPVLLRTTNGVHNTAGTVAIADAGRWFRYWLDGEETGIVDEPRVKHHFGVETTSLPGSLEAADVGSRWTLGGADFPHPDTDWTRFHLDEGGDLLGPDEGPGSGSRSYATGSTRQSWSFEAPEAGNEVALAEGPDVLTYRSAPVDEPTVLAGPVNAVLHVTSTAAETDIFVRIADEFEDESGETRVVPLQRGLVRASFRRLADRPPADPDGAVLSGQRTWYSEDGGLVRPYRPHTTIDPVVPGERERYDVEVFPLAHVLYPGHRLVVRIHTPPSSDGLWGYEPSREPGVNVVHHDPGSQSVDGPYAPSSVLLPVVETDEVPGEPDDFGAYAGYRELAGYRDPGTGSGLPGGSDAP